MENKIANNIYVGVFVTVGLVAFVFLLFKMGGGSGVFSSRYSLYANYKDVKGLHYGSEVALSGLRVGIVSNIEIAENGGELKVELEIDKGVKDRIRSDSVAKIVTQGVLGDKYIEITLGTPQNPELKHGEFITTQESLDLFARSSKLMEGIAKHFNQGGDIEKFMTNLNSVLDNLAVITGSIAQGGGGAKLNASFSHLEGILNKVNSGQGTLGAFINDPTLYEDMKSLLGGAKRSSILRYFVDQFVEDGRDSKK